MNPNLKYFLVSLGFGFFTSLLIEFCRASQTGKFDFNQVLIDNFGILLLAGLIRFIRFLFKKRNRKFEFEDEQDGENERIE